MVTSSIGSELIAHRNQIMAEKCRNCGLELFEAQRFCRSCGAPTEQLSDEEAPTRIMPSQPPGWGARSGATAPTSRPETNPVYEPPSGYQPTVPPMYPQTVPPYTPPRKRSPLGWVLAFIGIGLFAVLVFAVMMMARWGRRFANEIPTTRSEQVAKAGETALNESTADQVIPTPNETTFVKTFPLDADAAFSLQNMNGSVVVSGWDKPRAEVRAIQRGSGNEIPVFFTVGKKSVSIRTAETRGGRDLRYEIKLPQELGRVDIRSVKGSIKVSDIAGTIAVEAVNGTIELSGVSGVSKAKTVNGSIKSILEEASNVPMEFSTVSGSIDLTVKSGFDATLDASAVHGSISIDDQFGISVEKQLVGQHARGEIGSGGQPLKLTTVNGSIKLAKQ